MKKLLAAVVLFGGMLSAADVTGAWTGMLRATRGDGSEMTDSVQLVLKQQGTELTGSAGPASDTRPIQNGKVDGDQVTFEVQTTSGLIKAALKVDGDTMKGRLTRTREGQEQTAELEVKRAK